MTHPPAFNSAHAEVWRTIHFLLVLYLNKHSLLQLVRVLYSQYASHQVSAGAVPSLIVMRLMYPELKGEFP